MKNSLTYKIDNNNPEEKKRFIQKLFDSIVPTYDLLNHVLSLGTDLLWRRNIFKHLKSVRNTHALDLCCGTGDVSLLLHQKGAEVVSLDFSMNMLRQGIRKNALRGDAVSADVCHIPFQDHTFSVATIAFGIRNIPDIDHFIKEIFRVLTPGGQLAILELVRPENRLIRALYPYYLKTVLPFIGGVISGRRLAYKYLSKTIATFIDQSDLQLMLQHYGFIHITAHPQTFGIATIITCEKDFL